MKKTLDITNVNEFTSLDDELNKIIRIRKIFIIPFIFLILIFLSDFLFILIPQLQTSFLKTYLSLFAYYSFPFLLFYVGAAAFYSSYKLLGSRNVKNLSVFLLIVLAARFIKVLYNHSLPALNIEQSIIITSFISVMIPLLIFLAQRQIVIPSGESIKANEKTSIMGILISSMFALLIAGMVYLRVESGVQVVFWGVTFGILITIIVLKADKTLLGIFYFLEPDGAIKLFNIVQYEKDMKSMKDMGQAEILNIQKDINKKKLQKIIRQQKASLDTEEKHENIESLKDEIKEAVKDIEYGTIRDELKDIVNKVKDQGLSKEEKRAYIFKLRELEEQLKVEGEQILYLESPDQNLTISEKIQKLSFLGKGEIEDAIKLNLIASSQKHIWSHDNIEIIKQGLIDFTNNNFFGSSPCFAAKNQMENFQNKMEVLKELTHIFLDNKENSIPIKGLENKNIYEIKFDVVSKSFSAVHTKTIDGNSIFILNLIEL